MKEPENRTRYRARIELSARDTSQVVAAVRKWVDGLSKDDPRYEHHLTEALWLHQSHNVVDESFLKRLLRTEDYHARAAATRVLCYWRDRVAEPIGLLRAQANDAYPRVRLEAVRALSFFRDAKAAEAALSVLKYPMDYYLTYTLRETMTQLEPYWKKAIREDEKFAADNPSAVNYLLSSVGTAELLKMPRTDLVYQALLTRDNIVHDYRHEALMGLAKSHGTDMLTELLQAVRRLDKDESDVSRRVLGDLAHMLTSESPADLKKARDTIAAIASGASHALTRQVAYVALATADGSMAPVWDEASRSAATLRDLFDAISLIPDAKLRASAHERIQPFLAGIPAEHKSRWKDLDGTFGRYVRIQLPRKGTLTLAEVEVLSGGKNIATEGTARQSSESNGGNAARAIDGKKSGTYGDGGQTHSQENENSPWWELDLKSDRPIDAVVIWNRTEDGGRIAERLAGFDLSVLDSSRSVVFTRANNPAPKEPLRIDVSTDPKSALRRSAMNALVSTGKDEESTFKALAKLVSAGDERAAAVKALSRIPQQKRPSSEARALIDALSKQIEKLPASERTQPDARDALQLANDLAALLPAKDGQAVRRALRELGVPVVVLRPVPNLMVYDRPQLYVEAGKPIEIVFENVDIMPHNLIVARPGSLEKVGLEGERMAADPNAFAKGFVPSVPEVLQSTKLVQPGQSERINFTAPAQLGDYPYVCTFPGHWRRMNGVMHVVKSLDDVPPEALVAASAAPTGPVRPFVQAWTVGDLKEKLEHLAHGRNREQGKALFKELACATCHRINGVGGLVGPDLIQVKQKLEAKKMTLLDVLTEMVEPSKVIDEKFRPSVLVLADGQLISGIIAEETQEAYKLRSNPLDLKPGEAQKADDLKVISKADVQQKVTSEISLMPAGLLNTLTTDEILDLLDFVTSG